MNPKPLIYTRRTRGGQLFDITLTVFGWVFFGGLLTSGVMALVSHDLNEPHALPPTSLWASATSVLTIYALPVLTNALALVGWAGYNHRRFSGKTRRQPTPPLPGRHLQTSFELSPDMLERARDAHVMVIAHEQDSAAILEINIFAQGGSTVSGHESARLHPARTKPSPALTGNLPRHALPARNTHSGRDVPSRHWGWQSQTVLPITHSRSTALHIHHPDAATCSPMPNPAVQ